MMRMPVWSESIADPATGSCIARIHFPTFVTAAAAKELYAQSRCGRPLDAPAADHAVRCRQVGRAHAVLAPIAHVAIPTTKSDNPIKGNF